MSKVKAGEKVAKPIGIRVIEAKTGTMGVEVAFSFQEDGQEERLSWTGWLSEGAVDRTMKTLVETLGYNGDDEFKPGCMSATEVKLVVELEPAVKDGQPVCDKDGVQYLNPRIKWVNKSGGSAFAAAAPEKVKANLGKINFKGAFAAAKAASGQPTTKAETPAFSAEEIPF